ncbi:DNA polymerase III subunit gamma/tau [Wolbachia endosymbiont of Dipetalonema caudispina]|uniref:DNA polymerase III subunit gamma/tau n=1 Tax=Wolbachia endosymbiont of Dipetalonema caudispina TaxID=1812112 RepID=UPI00158AEDEB|nr:DNA polymerase III subunit gamma/tau [Wolbachia endosymbiont of Dipetalonema caudispina]QKX00963.1 DNA polymerase III subunit gamma/tau [Wolbachia endosymbiont of Dipetalonema caudispina]
MNIALKYRPGNFKELIGQDILVHIFKNAFTLNKIPQSVLLSGSSGVGKTTTARIIALCLNCSLGPTFEPCGLCENCLAIKNSSHPDVIEIDAASHTSVEDIKVILGDVCYLPISSKFKIYIIDEVHMLSSSAFNALLKTLEEPPSNVKFILATTEVKKIPVTVIARCQRFDLHKIPVIKIVKHLNDIAKKENFFVESRALELIAYHCGNSMRNALFLMNQAMLYSKDLVSVENVTKILSLVDEDIVFNLMETLLDGNLQETLLIFDEAAKVVSPLSILESLLQAIQLICRFLITKEISSSVLEYGRDKIKNLSTKRSLIFFARLWKVLLKGIQDIKASTCSDIAAEMILISLCYLSDLPSPEQVVKKVLAHDTQQSNTYDVEDMQQKKNNFNKILQLLQQNNQIYLYKQLCNNLQLIDCKPGYLKLKAVSQLNSDFCDDLKKYLNQVTQYQWLVIVDLDYVNRGIRNLSCASVVKDILDTFKGAKVVNIEDKE